LKTSLVSLTYKPGVFYYWWLGPPLDGQEWTQGTYSPDGLQRAATNPQALLLNSGPGEGRALPLGGMLVTPAELPIDLNEPLRDSFAADPKVLSTLHLGPFDGCLFVSQDQGALEGPQKEFRTEQVLEAWGLPGPGEGSAKATGPDDDGPTAETYLG